MMTRRRLLIAAAAAPLSAAVAACSSRATDASGSDLAGTVLGIPLERPRQSLLDTDGNAYDFGAATSGELAVIFFGYTSCPDVCPVNLANLATALSTLGGELERTTVVFVGVDVERDTPEVMRAYLDGFDSRFVGLTGADDTIGSMMSSLNLPPVVITPPEADGTYDVAHASQMLVFTPDDLCHVVYPFGTRTQDWVADLPRLADYPWPKDPS